MTGELTPRCGIAGLDANLRIEQAHGSLGIAGLDHAGKIQAASLGIAGLNCSTVARAAGVGVAGYLSSKIRQRLPAMLAPTGDQRRERLGDRVAAVAWQHGVYFLDYTYCVCTADRGDGRALRWREGREAVFGRAQRIMPLFLDCGSYRIWSGRAPRWAGLETYLQAIDLLQPDGFAAFDVIGDQVASRANFVAMTAAGYGPERGCFPVFQVRPAWDPSATITGVQERALPAAARCAIANARLAARDPILQEYARQSRIIGLGGMVKGPIPRDVRGHYIAALARAFPDNQFWGLGQANYKVVNQLGGLGLLDRVWLDGSWWVLDSACDRFGVVKEGQIVMLSLEGLSQSLFTIEEMMAANLRCLLAAYAGLIQFPAMKLLPDLTDADQVQELHGRLQAVQLELFGTLATVRTAGGAFLGPARMAEDQTLE